jgi:hypothetical protein
MSDQKKPRGGVITSEAHHMHGVVQLLTFHLRNRLELVYYPHPNDIEVAEDYDFVIALSLDDLRAVIKHYDAKQHPVPLLLHIDEPETLHDLDYTRLFPRIEVAPIAQANLDAQPGVTLQLGLFSQIIERLAGRF